MPEDNWKVERKYWMLPGDGFVGLIQIVVTKIIT